MVRPAPIPSDPARSCSAPCRLPSPPRQCHHNPQQTPPPPRPDDGPVRRETALPWKTAPGWVQHRSPPQHMVWYDHLVVNLYLTLSRGDSIISGQVLSLTASVVRNPSRLADRCIATGTPREGSGKCDDKPSAHRRDRVGDM